MLNRKDSAASINACHRGYPMKYAKTFRQALILIGACANAGVQSAEKKPPELYGAAGATDARPLSIEWLDYWGEKYVSGDETASRLVVELVRSEANTDSWSERTEAELRASIATDPLLKRNAWNTVRCSQNGCIAAIDPLLPDSSPPPDNILIETFRSHLVSHMTPRLNPSKPDFTVSENDGNREKHIAYRHLLFFFFPESSNTTGKERKSTD
jgi:hypothetical protein